MKQASKDILFLKLAREIEKHGLLSAVNLIFPGESIRKRSKIAGSIAGLFAKESMAVQAAPQMGPQTVEIPSPNGARASALMNRLTGGVQQMQQPQAAPEGIQ